MRLRLVFPLLLIASVFALAACGGGGDEGDKVAEAIEISASSDDPADCKKFSTQKFMEQTTKSSGSEALETCEEQASNEEGVEAATASNVEVDGSQATADVALTGGTLDGQAVEVALVKDGDQWQLDEIVRFNRFEPDKVTAFFEREFAKPSAEISEKRANCIVEAFADAPEDEFEEALLNRTAEGFEEIAGSCLT